MQSSVCLLLLFAGYVSAAREAVSPVQKVIQMLNNMRAQGLKESEAEVQTMKDYTRFKLKREQELNWEVEDDKAAIEKLVASITKAESEVKRITTELTELDGQIATLDAELKGATEQRESDREQFEQTQTDYTESLYALDHAISTLQAQDYSRAQAMGLLQQDAASMKGMRKVLVELALLQEPDEGAPAVAAYEFQSSGIVQMLEKLRVKFSKELGELEKAEMNGAHAYEMQKVHLTDALRDMNANRKELAVQKARNAATAAKDKGTLATTRTSLAASEKFLGDLLATYRVKEAQFAENQEVRKQEIEALTKAVEIMSSGAVSDAYGTHVKSLAQLRGKPITLLQAHSEMRRGAAKRLAVKYLESRAAELGSKALAQVAADAAANPFGKVIDMVEGLLAKLKEEAASEADHKAYCDEELKKNKLRRDKMTSKVARLHAEIEEKIVEIAGMAKDIAQLAEEQATLRESIKEATATRQEEKPQNEATIKDSAAAQVAVKQAIAILAEFYATQAGLLQTGKQVPEMASYGGMNRQSGGVAGMLEVILSDFARVEADTRAAEESAAVQYKQFMEDSEADLEQKRKAEFKKGLEKDQSEFDQEQLQKDLDATQEQLDMANAYFQTLKPQCIQVHVSFEERSKMRAEEVEALKQAYAILSEHGNNQ